MVNIRKRTLKYLTFFLLFIFLTSFVLNYNMGVSSAWFPKQIVLEFSENLRKFIKPQPCTCRHCISQGKVSYWFDQRFNKTMQPLLTAHNALMEEDTYRWWLVSRLGSGSGVGVSWGPTKHLTTFRVSLHTHTPTPPTIPSLSSLSNVYYAYIREKPCCFLPPVVPITNHHGPGGLRHQWWSQVTVLEAKSFPPMPLSCYCCCYCCCRSFVSALDSWLQHPVSAPTSQKFPCISGILS